MKNHLLKICAFTTIIFLILSCSSDPNNPNIPIINPNTPAVVYVGGWCNKLPNLSIGSDNGTTWKNGVETIFPNIGVIGFQIKKIFASGNDLYTTGLDWVTGIKCDSRVYKNESLAYVVPDFVVGAFFVIGTDTYLAGVDYPNQTKIKIYKNGTELMTINHSVKVFVQDMFVKDNDIYIVGAQTLGLSRIAKIWKNGLGTDMTDGTLAGGGINASGMSIFITVNNDVYVAGFQSVYAKLWKNGVPATLNNNTQGSCAAYSVFVANNKVYVSGYLDNAHIPAYWVDGEVKILSGGFTTSNIFVHGQDVYVLGQANQTNPSNYASGVLWKNDQVILNVNSASFTSLFVK